MTDNQLTEKLDYMLSADGPVIKHIRERAQQLVSRGGIEIETFPNDYNLPRILITVGLQSAAWHFEPNKKYQQDVKNLSQF